MTTVKSALINPQTGGNFVLPSVQEISKAGSETWSNMDMMTVSQVLSSLQMPQRSKREIYSTYLYMCSDPVVSTALKLHVTNALGGHETTGDAVSLESKAGITKNEQTLVEELQQEVLPYLNKLAYSLCYTAVGYGDAYSRVRGKKGKGITSIEENLDFYIPPLVQPFEVCGQTAGYEISANNKLRPVPLNAMQMARVKIPRMTFVPQPRVQMNHWREAIAEDDETKMPMLPASVGGSFCEFAEKPYFLLQSALMGLNSNRIQDSIKEYIIGVNMQDMTRDQQKQYMEKMESMFLQSRAKAQQAINNKEPIVEKIFHFLPTWQEKQVYSISQDMAGQGNAQSYTIEDIMFYAKLLAASFGIDLSMLGFAELASGSSGDSSSFQASTQAYDRSRVIRQAYTEFCNHIIDIHCHYKYGGIMQKGNRPYSIHFVGSDSAMEYEKQITRERKTRTAISQLQTFETLQTLGFSQGAMELFIKNEMNHDKDNARRYSQELTKNRGQ